MIWRWLLRLALIATAFFIGMLASAFLVIFTMSWDQALVDFFGVVGGLALAFFAFFKSRPLTRPKVGGAS